MWPQSNQIPVTWSTGIREGRSFILFSDGRVSLKKLLWCVELVGFHLITFCLLKGLV
jgi:hypothetical protein